MADHIYIFDEYPQAKMRLICFPYAGAAASAFRLWPAKLSEQIELCAVEYPGRAHSKETAVKTMQEMVDKLYPEIVPLFDKPCAFFGHSFGSGVAYEITKKLEAQGLFPLHLFVSARRAPQVLFETDTTYNLSPTDFLKAIENKYGAINKVILNDKDLLGMFLPILRDDLKINETYQGSIVPQIKTPVTLYYGTEDRSNDLAALEKWKETTSGAFRIKTFPGGHFYIDTARDSLIKDIVDSFPKTVLHDAQSLHQN